MSKQLTKAELVAALAEANARIALLEQAKTGLPASLRVQRDQYREWWKKAEDERQKVATSLAEANEAYNQMAAKYDEAERQLAVYRRSLELLTADVERLQNESAGHTADECEADAIQAEYEALEAELRENLSLRDGVVTAWMGELGTTLVPAIAAVLQATEPQEARP